MLGCFRYAQNESLLSSPWGTVGEIAPDTHQYWFKWNNHLILRDDPESNEHTESERSCVLTAAKALISKGFSIQVLLFTIWLTRCYENTETSLQRN